MSDDDRKPTLQMPAASNLALAGEKNEAFGREHAEMQRALNELVRKFDALREIQEHQTKLREEADGRLGRSIDRLGDKVDAVAIAQNRQVTMLGEIIALCKASVDGTQANAIKIDELLSRGLVSAPAAHSAE